MAYDPNNPFARILRGELPCIKLFEDSQTLAIMDIMPQADGHCLVITKEAAETLHDVSADGAAACIRSAQRLANAVKAALHVPGVLVAQFNGAAAGQTVAHLHFHVIPSVGGADLRLHARAPAATDKLQALAARIVSQL